MLFAILVFKYLIFEKYIMYKVLKRVMANDNFYSYVHI